MSGHVLAIFFGGFVFGGLSVVAGIIVVFHISSRLVGDPSDKGADGDHPAVPRAFRDRTITKLHAPSGKSGWGARS